MILAVMPCKGRITQTLALIPRLLRTAGLPADAWKLVVNVDDDEVLMDALHDRPGDAADIDVIGSTERNGYWRGIRNGITWGRAVYTSDTISHVVNLANDLLPGKDWLKLGMDAYHGAFANGDGIMGFNDGIHHGTHAAHFIASVPLLRRWYGDDYVPLCYDHMYGDTEINLRAKAERKLAVAPWAVLYHNHAYVGAAPDDIYQLGHARYAADEALFNYRRAHHWTNPPQEAPHVLRPETRSYADVES